MLGDRLDAALSNEFFQWFHLERYEPPQALADGKTWHGFRPEGKKFRDLVTLNLETAADRIAETTLCLDRAFVEHAKDGAFARDLAASYLRWTLSQEEQASIRDFMSELGDLGPNVIRLASAVPPPVPAQPSNAYRVFIGRDKDCEIALPGKILRLVNLQARDGPRDPRHDWIWLRVYAN
jgi:hypothetical protein